MQLSRPKPPQRLISLVSMIDVLLIMLVFFMVTSTYLNLDMIPVARATDESAVAGQASQSAPMMIRLGPAGTSYLRGQVAPPEMLTRQVQAHVEGNQAASILILPSPHASTQSLVTLMDNLTQAGASNLRILQLTAIE